MLSRYRDNLLTGYQIMAFILFLASQKGGVGKSMLARLIAVIAAKAGLSVKIADLDTQQSTSVNWSTRRKDKGFEPEIRTESFSNIKTALKDSQNFDLYIFDGAPHSSAQTLQVSEISDMIIIPTSEGLDDLIPAVDLANNLFEKGISPLKIAFALCITSDSTREIAGARKYLGPTPYKVLDGEIPFRSAFKGAMDRGKAITETPFPTLRKRAEAMAQNIIDAVASATEAEKEVV